MGSWIGEAPEGWYVTDESIAEYEADETCVHLDGPRLTDAGLAHLRKLPALERLKIACPNVTDAGLLTVGSLTTVRELQLFGAFTDAGMAALVQLTDLSYLSVNQCKVTDAGLASIARLTGLRTLVLFGALVNGSGLAALAALVHLESLFLSDTPLDDAALDAFAQLPALRELTLQKTNVTDKGLAVLARLRNLRVLNLSRTTYCTREAVEELQRALPDCEIDWAATPGPDHCIDSDDELRTLWPRWTAIQIGGPNITDSGLASLTRLTNLLAVELRGCSGVTAAGLRAVAGLPTLNNLLLQDRDVTAEDIAALDRPSGLDLLCLVGCRLAEGAMAAMSHLTGLGWLTLNATPASEADLEHLPQVKGLTVLCFVKQRPALLEQLQRTMPNCRINVSQ